MTKIIVALSTRRIRLSDVAPRDLVPDRQRVVARDERTSAVSPWLIMVMSRLSPSRGKPTNVESRTTAPGNRIVSRRAALSSAHSAGQPSDPVTCSVHPAKDTNEQERAERAPENPIRHYVHSVRRRSGALAAPQRRGGKGLGKKVRHGPQCFRAIARHADAPRAAVQIPPAPDDTFRTAALGRPPPYRSRSPTKPRTPRDDGRGHRGAFPALNARRIRGVLHIASFRNAPVRAEQRRADAESGIRRVRLLHRRGRTLAQPRSRDPRREPR